MSETQPKNYIDIAKQQLLKELIDKRVIDLDDWLTQCDIVWKEQHVLLPYPKSATYPSEDEVLARVKLLNPIKEENNNKKEKNENVITQPVVEHIEEKVEVIETDSKDSTEDSESNTQNTEEIKFETGKKNLPLNFNYRRKK